MAETAHSDIAAYILGVLDEPDHIAFEAHLLACPHCQLDLLEMQDLPELLSDVKRSWPLPPVRTRGQRELITLLDEAAVIRRKRRCRVRTLVAAAVLLIIAGPLLTMAFRPAAQYAPQEQTAAASTAVPEVHTGSAASPNEGIKAQSEIDHSDMINAVVYLEPKDWGTHAELELSGIVGPLQCKLIAVSRTGETAEVMTWAVPPKGYGVPSSPDPLRVSGGTSIPAADIQKFEVRTANDILLVTVER